MDKKTIKLNESQLRDVVKESVTKVLNEIFSGDDMQDMPDMAGKEIPEMEGDMDEGFFNNLKTGAKTFFKNSGGLGDKWNAAKKNFSMQGEYDQLSSLKQQLSDLIDKRMINPNTTVAQLVGGKYNGNKFGTMSGMLGNRQAQMNRRMSEE